MLFSQAGNTPYSRFGIGKLYQNSSSLSMAMGGSSGAIRSPLFINPFNPASYTSFDSNSFIFDAALSARMMTLKTSTSSAKMNDAGLAYITMGFPVTRWWKTSLGILPFSSMEYQIIVDSVLPNIGKVQYDYSGSGGLNRAFVGNAFQPVRDLSIGFNMSYIFGTLNHQRTLIFPDSSNHWSSRMTTATLVRSLYFDFGLQYLKNLKNGLIMTSGVTFSPGQPLSSTADFLAVSFYHNYSSNLDIVKDTSVYNQGVSGDIRMPFSLGAGLSLNRMNRWNVTADVNYQQWSGFRYFGSSQSLSNTFRVSLGGQFRPSTLDIGKYWKRINYRAGVRFEQSFLELRSTRLNDFGISFGVGLPMKKTRSLINIALEAGTFGTTENRLIKENYFRFTLGASVFEKWFLKRKYD